MKQRTHISESRVQFRFVQMLLIAVVSSVIAGCSLTAPTTPDDVWGPSNVMSEHAPAEEVWQALAHAVDARTIETTTRLAQYVVVLARNGELSEQDVAAFDTAFPKIAANSRDLTDADRNALIDLARKTKG